MEFNGKKWEWQWWNGEKIKSSLECPAACDTETSLIRPVREPKEGEDIRAVPTDPRHVPDLAIFLCFDGEHLYAVHPSKVQQFLTVNVGQYFTYFNIGFDWWVLHKHCGTLGKDKLWDLAARGRLKDGMVLDLLLQLATGNYRKVKGGGKKADEEKLYPTNLSVLAKEYGEGDLDKGDAYRLRFGEWVGLSQEQIDAHPERDGFFRYCWPDVIALHGIYKQQRGQALELMQKAGWSNKPQKLYEMRPDCVAKWDVLSLDIQVRAAITLTELSRTPLRIDQEKRKELELAARDRYQYHMRVMMELEPHVVQRYKPKKFKVVDGVKVRNEEPLGELKLNPKTGFPKVSDTVLKQRLLEEAQRLQIEPPISKGKTKALSKSAKDWEPYKEESTFLTAFCGQAAEQKLMAFFLGLEGKEGVVYSRYDLLKRSGRTSANQWKTKKELILPSVNVQQIPRENEDSPERDVRQLFCVGEKKKWVASDYKAIEMATLAASCVARFGKSRMKEVIFDNIYNGGPDLHQITAAAILSVEVPEFLNMNEKVQKKRRREAKECFHPDTEILTENGWVKVGLLKEDVRVAQFWPETKSISWTLPIALTEREDKPLVRIWNEGVDIRVTPDHRILGYMLNGKSRVVLPQDVNLLRGVWNAGILEDSETVNCITDQHLRQAVCIQADGSFQGKWVRFGFRKERKIAAFRKLFPDAIPKLSIMKNVGEVTTFKVPRLPEYEHVLNSDKTFKLSSLMKLTSCLRRAFLEEVGYWDSHRNFHNRSYMYSTADRSNVEAIQTVGVLTGWKVTLTTEKITKPNRRDSHKASVKFRDYSRSGNFKVEELPGRHKVYCLSVPSSYVVARDCGKTVIIGNCNFGFPGGMGVSTFVRTTAKKGIHFTTPQAKEAKKKWMDAYPEMYDHLADSTQLALAWQSGVQLKKIPELSFLQKKRYGDYIKGKVELTGAEKEMFFELVESLAYLKGDEELEADAVKRTLTPRIKRLFEYRACTLTGRVRNNVTFSSGKNAVFQGIAADGAKEAIFRLMRMGKRVLMFVHDEICCEVDEKRVDVEKAQIEKVMVEEMARVVGHGVPIAVESGVADRWHKG